MLSKNTNLVTINGGSSSIKFAMYKMAKNPVTIFSGNIARIGSKNEIFTVTNGQGIEKQSKGIYAPGFYKTTVFMLNWLEEQPDFD
jgi:acetate kinase